MPRPKGSKNKPKSEPSAASRKPDLRVVDGGGAGAIGDNSDKNLALTMHHKALYIAAMDKKKKADADFKNVCKTIKADLGETGIKDIKTSMMLDDLGDNSVIKAEIERLMRCASWAGMPIGTQGSLFAEDRRTLNEKAFDEGKYAGLNGKNPASPHQPGSDLDQSWMRGWHAGQGELKAAFLKNNETKVLRPVDNQQSTDDDDAAAAADLDSSMGEDSFGDDAGQDEPEQAAASLDRPGRKVNGIEIVGEEPPGLAPAPDIKWPDGAGEDADLRPRYLATDNTEL